jgi:hypothetical protein
MSFNPGINDNQNFRIQNGRPSSRVLAPSGGHSSLSFGVAPPKPKPEPPAVAVVDKEEQQETTEEQKVEQVQVQQQQQLQSSSLTTTTTATTTKPTTTLPQPKQNGPISANAFASGSSMNGPQVMTGRPTSRVLAPPGGHTSIKLG